MSHLALHVRNVRQRSAAILTLFQMSHTYFFKKSPQINVANEKHNKIWLQELKWNESLKN